MTEAEQQKTNSGQDKKTTIEKVKIKKAKKPFNFLLLFLFVNMILFLGSLYLMYDLPQKAQELKNAKNEALEIEQSSRVDATGLEITQNKQNWEELQSYFLNEAGVIKFITDLEGLKKSEAIKDMSFVSQDAVRDKTGTWGIPFIMEIEGDWKKVDEVLHQVYDLPYIVRVINVDATELESGVVNLKFGGFVYVSEELGKNR